MDVAPVRERGLKFVPILNISYLNLVAPVRERGLKCAGRCCHCGLPCVAPVRERGLKSPPWPAGACAERSLP